MSNFRINYEHPWLLLLLVPAVVLSLLPYFRSQKKYRRNRNKIISLTAHLSALILAINLLAGISFSYEKPNLENELVILVDTSDSSEDSLSEKTTFVQSLISISDNEYRVGVVNFGFDSTDTGELTFDTDVLLESYLSMPMPDNTATDIASALKHARSLITHPETSKIVVLSDGIETDNSVLSIIKSIAADGIKVDTAYFPNEDRDEVSIISADVPKERIVVGESFTVSLNMRSNLEGENNATLRVTSNGEPLGEAPVILKGMEQELDIAISLDERGLHELCFEIEVDGDTLAENNKYHTYVNLSAFDNLLVIERLEGEGAPLTALLKDRFNVTDMSISLDVDKIPRTIEELAEYEQVVLVNMAYSDMPAGFEELLNQFVYDLGGGLFTVGGELDDENQPHAYNRLDIRESTYFKQMLPVNVIEYTPPIAVMIVVDTSGSMSYDNKLINAKKGAEGCLEALNDRDFCGVMSFNTAASEELQVLPCSQRDTIIDSIRRIGGEDSVADGGTVFTAAIERAGLELAAVNNVERKHIILVTDGLPGDDFETFVPYINNNVKDGITMSVITLGVDTTQGAGAAIAEMMQKTADLAKGSYINVMDPRNVPAEMEKDLRLNAVAEIDYGEAFELKIKDRTAAVSGIEEALIPKLKGYYGTMAKSSAKVSLVGKYVPIYADWQYGAGKVGSFMCDLTGIWSDEFILDTVGQQIIYNIVNSLFPANDIRVDGISYVIKTENYNNQLNVHGVPDGCTVEVNVTPLSDHLSNTVEDGITVLAQESNRRFSFVIKDAGLYEVQISAIDEGGVTVAEVVDYVVFSYSDEYDVFTSRSPIGEELMALIAEDGKGNVINDPALAFIGFEDTIKLSYDPRIILLISAIILVLIDIAVRKFKFKWPHELIREYRIRKNEIQK